MVEVSRDWFEHRHNYAREWQEKTGKEVMGFEFLSNAGASNLAAL